MAERRFDNCLSGSILTGSGIAKPELLDEIREEAGELLTHILKLAVNDEVSPRLDLSERS